MKNFNLIVLVLFAVLFVYTLSTAAQETAKAGGGSAFSQVAGFAGKATVIVVGSAAKVAWGTTKFAGKNLAMPVARSVVKPILFKLTPKVSLFALRLAGKSVKKAVPVATKAGYAYLRTRVPV